MTHVSLVGRSSALGAVEHLLDGASAGGGGLLAVIGPPGSGKSAVLGAAAGAARRRGIETVRGFPGPIGAALGPRLILVDDADAGALPDLAALASEKATAVVATASHPLGIGEEVRLGPLSEDELAEVVGVTEPEIRRALWVASGGWPGPARQLVAGLAGPEPAIVQLGLEASSRSWFLRVDTDLVRLMEAAIEHASDDGTRARLVARLARELLGDASASERRGQLAAEAIRTARQVGDPGLVAEVLDAALGARWEPAGATDRLDTGAEIIRLARQAGDRVRERAGLFWRFVALMELGRVGEAESVLASFEHQAELSGDEAGMLMAKSRQAFLAAMRGRFDDAARMADEVLADGRRIRLPDAGNLAKTIHGMIAKERGDGATARAGAQELLRVARHDPGHFHEATAAHILAGVGRLTEAGLELERVLPRVLAGSGPRLVGALADVAFAAAATGDVISAGRIYEKLLPFNGGLVVFGGAVFPMEPVSHYLGLLATALGDLDVAVSLLSDAVVMEERISALPFLANTLDAQARALEARRGPGDGELAAAARARAHSIAQRLGMTVLLARSRPTADVWGLTSDEGDWVLSAGPEHVRLRDGRGIEYLRALLAAPGRDIPALELAGGGESLVASDPETVLDDAARRSYRARLDELDAELDRADRAGDPVRAEKAGAERQAILDELRRAAGLGGRPRPLPNETERARVNVTRTIRTTLEQIGRRAPVAGAHLRASIRTGRMCRYQPGPGGPSRWSL